VVLVHERAKRGHQRISRPPEAIDPHAGIDVAAEHGLLHDADDGQHHPENDERLADVHR
jgi:hypothetical protein